MKLFADGINITATVGALEWHNSLAELATTLTFDVVKQKAKYSSVYLPTVGSIVNLVLHTEIFRGIVLTVDDGDFTVNHYTAVDFGFYLNKSTDTYQFSAIGAQEAIAQICSGFGIPIDALCAIPYTFTKIYFDKPASEVIQDILDSAVPFTGYAYHFFVTPRGLLIYRLGDLTGSPHFRLSPNTQLLNSTAYRGNVSHSTSMDNLINSVKVIAGDENGFTTLAIMRDDTLIESYGLLQAVEKIDIQYAAQAEGIARQRLKDLSQIKQTFSFDIIEDEDSNTRAGYEIYVDGVAYIVEGTSHSIVNGNHHVHLDVRRAMPA